MDFRVLALMREVLAVALALLVGTLLATQVKMVA
jgi:hypothetical protein